VKRWPIDVDNDGYTDTLRTDVEQYWKGHLKRYLDEYHLLIGQTDATKCYCLSMFPYPSGTLHMGHVRVYTLSNLFAQYYRMRGYNVIHPIGWDAFGLPAENAAFERGVDTLTWTYSNIDSMRQQLDNLDLTLDWRRQVITSDPSYYKWTQWMFVKMFENGLAYQANATVNWDPVDNTVLANEQVDEEGRSWRSGAVVEKKRLKQWFFNVSKYSISLLEGIDTLHLWPKAVKKAQKEWIGKRLVVCFVCDVVDSLGNVIDSVRIATPQPEMAYSAESVLTHVKNFLLKRIQITLYFTNLNGCKYT